MRFVYTVVTIYITILIIGSACTTPGTKDVSPNVIIIMTDDQGNNLECLGNQWLKTPNINQLAKESVYLSNFHQDMLCTPSRASLMTGRYAIRTGAWRTSRGRSMMRTEETTIAEIFRDNGYKTGQFGKWHLGDTWPFRPEDQGFEEVVGHVCGGIGQISDHWGNDYFDDVYQHNSVPTQYEGYCTDVFFNEAIRFIKAEKDNPFLVYLAPNITHVPNVVAEEYSKPYMEMGLEKGQAVYYGMAANFDENMGRLLGFLEEEGLKENTILLYTTDDGPQANGQQFDEGGWALDYGFNMGQRGGKGSSYEGGHRLFSYIRWPAGKINAGKEVSELTSVMDILPSLLELCQIDKPSELELDGRSFAPALYGKAIPGSDKRSLVISKFNNDEQDTLTGNMCIMYKDWRVNNMWELFDVGTDREQRNNIAADHPQVMEEMKSIYRDWLNDAASTIKEPVRFVLGKENAPTITLTTQDTYMPKGNSAFSQRHVSELNPSNGPWKVKMFKNGNYRFTLSRYPLYTGLPFNINAQREQVDFDARFAKLKVGDQVVQKEIKGTDNHVVIEMELKAGDADLQTWLISSDGIEIPSYFVEIEIN